MNYALALFLWFLPDGTPQYSTVQSEAGTNYVIVDRSPEVSAPAPAPELHQNGIITPILYMPSTPNASNGFAVAVQPDGSVDTEHWYGSPTNTPEEIKAAFDQKHKTRTASNSNRLTRIERIAIDLKQVDGTISNINANAATWPNQAQRDTISAIKIAVRNLMQATEKVRKELEP